MFSWCKFDLKLKDSLRLTKYIPKRGLSATFLSLHTHAFILKRKTFTGSYFFNTSTLKMPLTNLNLAWNIFLCKTDINPNSLIYHCRIGVKLFIIYRPWLQYTFCWFWSPHHPNWYPDSRKSQDSLRKHAYSNILKILQPKKEIFR